MLTGEMTRVCMEVFNIGHNNLCLTSSLGMTGRGLSKQSCGVPLHWGGPDPLKNIVIAVLEYCSLSNCILCIQSHFFSQNTPAITATAVHGPQIEEKQRGV